MTYSYHAAGLEHLGWLRLLYSELLAAEQLQYPTFDEAELDAVTLFFHQQLTTNPQFYCELAKIGKRYVGFLAGEIQQRALGRPHTICTAHWLYITPKHRGQGVARDLIAHGAAWLTARNISHVELVEKYGHERWTARGFTPYLVRYMMPVSTLAANESPGALPQAPAHALH